MSGCNIIIFINTNIMAELSKVTFMTVDAFKQEVGVNTFKVLKNPNTGKLFLNGDEDSTKNFKVEAAIDFQKEMKMLVPDEGGISEACLVNVKPGAEVLATF
jgi:hypothetical protein